MSENTDLTSYQNNRDMTLSKAKYYYKNNKEGLREQARDKHRSLFEEEKKKKENTEKIDITICLRKGNKD